MDITSPSSKHIENPSSQNTCVAWDFLKTSSVETKRTFLQFLQPLTPSGGKKIPRQTPRQATLNLGSFGVKRFGFPFLSIPIGSMYGIFTYIWLIFMVNVGKYTIHGSYGINAYASFICPKNHGSTLRFWGDFGCVYIAGVRGISKPPGFWDPMILRVRIFQHTPGTYPGPLNQQLMEGIPFRYAPGVGWASLRF